MAKPIVTTAELEQIRDLIRERLGLGLWVKDLDCLQQQICNQMTSLRLEFGSEYFQLLKAAPSTHDLCWQNFVRELTKCYLEQELAVFRDRDQQLRQTDWEVSKQGHHALAVVKLNNEFLGIKLAIARAFIGWMG